jgi:bifunctional glutamyl/prolyl-tRNA synthetase
VNLVFNNNLGNNVPKATVTPAVPTPSTVGNSSSVESIDAAITAQGNRIRDLKSQKAAKDILDKEVKQLLSLKAEFKTAAGKDWDPKG